MTFVLILLAAILISGGAAGLAAVFMIVRASNEEARKRVDLFAARSAMRRGSPSSYTTTD